MNKKRKREIIIAIGILVAFALVMSVVGALT